MWMTKIHDKKMSWCKSCEKTRAANYYKDNKQKHIFKVINRKKIIQEWFKEFKSDLVCDNCGYNKNPQILHFHHIDPKSKIGCVSNMVCSGFSKEIIIDEMLKCIVLCPTCHMETHV